MESKDDVEVGSLYCCILINIAIPIAKWTNVVTVFVVGNCGDELCIEDIGDFANTQMAKMQKV